MIESGDKTFFDVKAMNRIEYFVTSPKTFSSVVLEKLEDYERMSKFPISSNTSFIKISISMRAASSVMNQE